MEPRTIIRVEKNGLVDETFEITALLEQKETGRRWLQLRLPERNKEVIMKVKCSPGCIVSTLVDLGVIVRDKKELIDRLTGELFEKKSRLEVIALKPGKNDETSVFEEFVRFVWRNLPDLQREENLTRVEYESNGKTATVTINVSTMRKDFFVRTAGINDEEMQDAVLRYWKEEGWLETQPSQNGKLSVVATFCTEAGKKSIRAFRIKIPVEGLEYDEDEKKVSLQNDLHIQNEIAVQKQVALAKTRVFSRCAR